MKKKLGIWFLAIKTNTGTDIFTERLIKELNNRGIKAAATWLPLRAEYAPWTVQVPNPPSWATVLHINTWLHKRFIPPQLPVLATLHHAIHHPDTLSYKGMIRAIYHNYWIAPMERKVLSRSNIIIAVSRFVADTAQSTLSKVPIRVIYNGIDTEKFVPCSRSRRREQNAPFRLLYVGSWMARKGVDLLPRIMQKLGPEYELLYTGGPKPLKKTTHPGNMKNIGRITNEDTLVALMQEADALLFPSRSEGFGLVVAEAMACGLPVVAMKGSAVMEIITHEVDGFLCNREDDDAFIRSIQKLARTPDLRNLISANARKKIVSDFPKDSTTDNYLAIYEEISIPASYESP